MRQRGSAILSFCYIGIITLSVSSPIDGFAPAQKIGTSFSFPSYINAFRATSNLSERTMLHKDFFHRTRRRNFMLSVQSPSLSSSSSSSSSSDKDKSPVTSQIQKFGTMSSTKNMISLGIAFAVLFAPLQAHAGFGPSGGATTSPTPGVGAVNVQDLSQKKLKQLIGTSLDENRLNDFRSQFDAIIENLANTLTTGDETEADNSTPEEESAGDIVSKVVRSTIKTLNPEESERLEQAKVYQAQILGRERLLDSLEAQPWYFNYFAAFCGSVASTLVMHPVDTVKTRLMIGKSDDEDSDLFENLYEGLGGNILKEGPPSAIYLGVYETMKSSLLHGSLAPFWASLLGTGARSIQVMNANPTFLLSVYLAAGAVGELVGSTVRAPAEAMKSLVQAQTVSTTGEAFNMLLTKPEGRENVFRAWSSSALRDIPFGAIQIALFELIKAYILNNPNIDFDSSTLSSEAIIGAFAGGTGAFLTNPMDVITTRIITQETENGEALGVLKMGRQIYEEEGFSAFFSGWQARLLYWAPAISLFLTCYCSVRQLGVKLDWFS